MGCCAWLPYPVRLALIPGGVGVVERGGGVEMEAQHRQLEVSVVVVMVVVVQQECRQLTLVVTLGR